MTRPAIAHLTDEQLAEHIKMLAAKAKAARSVLAHDRHLEKPPVHCLLAAAALFELANARRLLKKRKKEKRK